MNEVIIFEYIQGLYSEIMEKLGELKKIDGKNIISFFCRTFYKKLNQISQCIFPRYGSEDLVPESNQFLK